MAIDGARDVRALAVALGTSEFETAKTIFGLESAGVLVLTESAERSSGSSVVDLDDVERRVSAALQGSEMQGARAILDPALSARPTDPRLQQTGA